MASYYQNLSAYDPSTVPNGEGMCIGIVVSEWNQEVTHALLEGAVNTLLKNGVKKENIFITHVPGSFELIYASSQMLKMNIDALIAIGCVVRGDTPHFDYICEGTTHGLSTLNTMQDTPVIYGLITTNTMEQALERCGGKFGNKGDECAITALKMVDFKRNMNSHNFHQ